jgi:hypothetical protein
VKKVRRSNFVTKKLIFTEREIWGTDRQLAKITVEKGIRNKKGKEIQCFIVKEDPVFSIYTSP